MRTNGTIQFQTISGGGFDDFGNPIAATSQWGAEIECFIQPNSNPSLMKYENGAWVQAAYTILLEGANVPQVCQCCQQTSATQPAQRIRIRRGGILLGEWIIPQINATYWHDSFNRRSIVV